MSLSCRQLLFTAVVIMFFLLHLLVHCLSVIKYCQFTNGTHFISHCVFLFPQNQCYYALFHLNSTGLCEPGSLSSGKRSDGRHRSRTNLMISCICQEGFIKSRVSFCWILSVTCCNSVLSEHWVDLKTVSPEVCTSLNCSCLFSWTKFSGWSSVPKH